MDSTGQNENKKKRKLFLVSFAIFFIGVGIALVYLFSLYYKNNPDSFTPTTADNEITNLTTANFASKNISQWTNDVNYLTSVGFSQITNGEGIFLDYRPGGVPCNTNQVLKYDATYARWVCGDDAVSGSSSQDLSLYATQSWVNSQGFLKNYYESDPTLVAWTGSTNINKVGTITSGTWHGAPITSTYIADGTIQLADLAQNACTDGQVMKWSTATSTWICAADDAVSGIVDWTSIANRPTGLDDGDDTLTEGQVETFVTNAAINLATGSTINAAPIASQTWVSSQGYITGYTESDPTLSTWAGSSNVTTVGTISSGTWNGAPITSAYIQNGTITFADIAQNGCTDGQVITWNTTASQWVCSASATLTESQVENYITNGPINLSASSTLGGNFIASQTWVQSQGYLTGYTETDPTLATWAGTSNITTVGTIASGTWNGTPITSTYIQDGTIQFADLSQNGCLDGQVIKWNTTASAWICATDELGTGGGGGSEQVQLISYGSNFTTSTTPTDIPTLTMTKQLINGRTYRWRFHGNGYKTTANTVWVNITDGSGTILASVLETINSTWNNEFTLEYRETGTGATVTRKVQAYTNGGSFTFNPADWTGTNMQFTLDDLSGASTSSVDWSNITNRPAGLDDGDDTLTEGQVETFVTNAALNLFTGSTVNGSAIATQTWTTSQGYLTSYTETDPTLATWAGTTNITTLGTVTSGTWNGTPITSAYIQDGTISLADIGQNGCLDGQVMQWNNTTTAWQCATVSGGTLTEGQVETYITNGPLNFAAGSTMGGANIATQPWVNAQGYLTSYTETDPTLATWAGTSNITTVGTISSGTWQGAPITSAYIQDGTISLADIGQNGCLDGQILKWSSGTTAWVCAVDDNSGTGGGGSTSIYESWDPDAPPVTASAENDEFSDGIIAAAWTQLGAGTKAETGSALQLSGESYVYKTLPAGDFSVWTKISASGKPQYSNYNVSSLAVQANSGTMYTVGFVGLNTNVSQIQVKAWSNYLTWSSDPVILGNNTRNDYYFSVRRSGSTLTFWISSDGETYNQIYSVADPGVNRVGFVNSGTSLSTYSFYRYSSANHDQYWIPEGRLIGIGGSGGGASLFETTNAAVAVGSYVEVTHNAGTNTVMANGWAYDAAANNWNIVQTASGGGYLVDSQSFSYRRDVTITNTAALVNNYQVQMVLDTSSLISAQKMKSDCSDLRITSDSAGTVVLPHWLESGCNTNATKIWTLVPTIAGTGTTTIYAFYGSSSATNASNYSAIFTNTLSGTAVLGGAWSLNETSGTAIADSSGNGINGVANGTTIVNGKYGKARSFNGTTDYADMNPIFAGTKNGNYAIELWVNIPTLPAKGGFFKTDPVGNGVAVGVGSGNMDNVGTSLIVLYEGARWIPTGATLTTGWHHIVLNLSNAGTPTIFLDGMQVYTDAGGAPYAHGGNLRIGSAGTRMYQGTIDEVRYYSNNLTSGDVTKLYNNQSYTTAALPGTILLRQFSSDGSGNETISAAPGVETAVGSGLSQNYKIVQPNNNTVRLYNYSGSTQNLKLVVSTSGGTSGGGISAIGDTITNATQGSILFAGASGVLSQNNSNLFWDIANSRLGIGTNTPATALHVAGAITQSGMSAPAASTAGTGRIYFDSTEGKFKVSENGGTYQNLVSDTTPDTPPATPNAMDDEFSDTTVDPKWTVYSDIAGGSYTTTEGQGSVVLQHLTTTANSNRALALVQTTPAGTWKVRSKMSIEGVIWNYIGAGIIVRNTSTDKTQICVLMHHSSMGDGLTGYYGRFTGFTLNTEVDLMNSFTNTYYLEMEYDGTNLNCSYSTTGKFYTLMYSEPVASHLGGAPTHVGITMHPYNTQGQSRATTSFDWFRRVQ